MQSNPQQPLEVKKHQDGYACTDGIEALMLALRGYEPINRYKGAVLFEGDAKKAIQPHTRHQETGHGSNYRTASYDNVRVMLAWGGEVIGYAGGYWYLRMPPNKR